MSDAKTPEIDFIAHHALQAQAGQSVFDALQSRFRCRWRLGADQAANGKAAAAVLLDHRAFHPRMRKSADGYRYLFHMSHDLGDIAVYNDERMDDYDLVLVPGRRHREAARAALGDADRVVEVGWPKFDPSPLPPEHAAQMDRLRALPHPLTVLYAPTWANTWEWRELIPWLAGIACNLVVKNHVLVDAGQPFPPGEERRYAECRRSIDAMEAAVRNLGSAARIVIAPQVNLCAMFPHVDVLITDSSSCALEFVPFGASIETGRTGAGKDAANDVDLQASRMCSAVQHLTLDDLKSRFPVPAQFVEHFAARGASSGEGASEVIAKFNPGAIGAGAAQVIEEHMARYPRGTGYLEPGGVASLAGRIRRSIARLRK